MSVVDQAAATHAWCRSTGGALSLSQQLGIAAAFAAEVPVLAGTLVAAARDGQPATGTVDDWLPEAPDSALTRAALEAARDQGPEIEGHGLRTWLFGAMLARRRGIDVDPELLHVGAIAHDAGIVHQVAGEDFTLRSADIAVAAFSAADRELDQAREARLRDGIVGHFLAGVDVERHPLAAAIQYGAIADLAGLRLTDLPLEVVREVYRRHPQDGVRGAITRAITAEARAVPRGRVAVMRRLGLPLLIRTAWNRDL